MNMPIYVHSNYQNASPAWLEPAYRQLGALKTNGSSSFCTIGDVTDPYREAGFACVDRSVSNVPVGFPNATTGGSQIFTEEDCIGIDGNWETFNCGDVNSLYKNHTEQEEVGQGDVLLALFSSSWESSCCEEMAEIPSTQTKDSILDYWWKFEPVKEYREGHGKNLTIIKGVMGIISVMASLLFIWMILRSHDGLSSSQHRILMGLCISDICFSFPRCFFGVMSPKEVGYWAWNASGNMATCQINGLILVFGSICGPWFNASLCIYYLAIVKYNKSDDYIRTKIEPFLHAVPIVLAIIYCIVAISTDGINANGTGTCSMGPHTPPYCWAVEEGSTIEGVFEIPCGRGLSAFIPISIFGLVVLLCPAVIMIASLSTIYRGVVQLEKKTSKYGIGSLGKSVQTSVRKNKKVKESTVSQQSTNTTFKREVSLANYNHESHQTASEIKAKAAKDPKRIRRSKKRSQSRTVLYKGVAYSCAWLLTWSCYIPIIIMGYYFRSYSLALTYVNSIFHPLQGVYNLSVYMHPKISSAKRSSKGNLSWQQAFAKAFWSKGKGDNTRKGHSARSSRPATTLRKRNMNKDTMACKSPIRWPLRKTSDQPNNTHRV